MKCDIEFNEMWYWI